MAPVNNSPARNKKTTTALPTLYVDSWCTLKSADKALSEIVTKKYWSASDLCKACFVRYVKIINLKKLFSFWILLNRFVLGAFLPVVELGFFSGEIPSLELISSLELIWGRLSKNEGESLLLKFIIWIIDCYFRLLSSKTKSRQCVMWLM